eukprot:2897884-Rhodomonas_salina.1
MRLSGGGGPDPSTAGFQARLRRHVGEMLGSVLPTVATSGWVEASKARLPSQGNAGEHVLELDLGIQQRARVA